MGHPISTMRGVGVLALVVVLVCALGGATAEEHDPELGDAAAINVNSQYVAPGPVIYVLPKTPPPKKEPLPTITPTFKPTSAPTYAPTSAPTYRPTSAPTRKPSRSPAMG